MNNFLMDMNNFWSYEQIPNGYEQFLGVMNKFLMDMNNFIGVMNKFLMDINKSLN